MTETHVSDGESYLEVEVEKLIPFRVIPDAVAYELSDGKFGSPEEAPFRIWARFKSLEIASRAFQFDQTNSEGSTNKFLRFAEAIEERLTDDGDTQPQSS